MRPCEYPREVIGAAIELVKSLVGESAADHAPFSGDPLAVAKMNHTRGRQSVLADLEGTLRTADREAAEKAKAR